MTNAIFHFHGDQSLQWNRGSMPEMPKQADPLSPSSVKTKYVCLGPSRAQEKPGLLISSWTVKKETN